MAIPKIKNKNKIDIETGNNNGQLNQPVASYVRLLFGYVVNSSGS
ncbi:hypothetical protein CASFOL_012845 [Castilleja foliolosa]|uniref:Uncharacterized protein n=1 Tax=Castilleja foliolosa TaxID=1961234 RepID=A0ABD3DI88_9LAMI